MAVRYCPECRHELAGRGRYCLFCGCDLRAAPPVSAEKPAGEERAKPAGEKREKPAEKKRRKPAKEEHAKAAEEKPVKTEETAPAEAAKPAGEEKPAPKPVPMMTGSNGGCFI